MTVIRWIIASVLMLFSLWAIMGNLWIAFGGLFKKREKSESLVPLVGGITGMVGMLLLPIEGVRSFCWVPLVADMGCIPLFAAVIVDQIKKAFVARSRK